MKNDLISVVVPVYNVQKYLKKCINSIVGQSYKNLQIILIDDGSTDDSGIICDEYAKKYQNIEVVHKKNGGLSDARNVGIKKSKGKYITFIDSDDYVEPDYIFYLYSIICKYNVPVSVCRHIVHQEKSGVVIPKNHHESKWKKEKIFEDILYSRTYEVSAWGKLYETNLFKSIKFPVGKLFEDVATTYKIIDRCEYIGVGDGIKYHYIMRKGSIVNNKFTENHKYMITATLEMDKYLSKKYPSLKKACKRRMVYAYMSTLNRMIICDEYDTKVAKQYRKIIMRNFSVVFDFNSSIRDKIGIISLLFGLNFYKHVWNFYRKKTGRC